jgi:hypothetical protein
MGWDHGLSLSEVSCADSVCRTLLAHANHSRRNACAASPMLGGKEMVSAHLTCDTAISRNYRIISAIAFPGAEAAADAVAASFLYSALA